MEKLELDTFVDCKDLPIEKVGELLGKFVELAEETPFQTDNLSEFTRDYENFLVYCKNPNDKIVIWFSAIKFNCNKERSYEDFFPE